MLRISTSALFLLLCATNARAGNVLVVAPTGAPYPDIQSAVAASADGDVILVKSGTFPGFSIGDQSLTIAEDSGATVEVQGPITVGPASAARTIVLSGLHAYAPYMLPPSGVTLTVASVAGFFRLENCQIGGADGAYSTTAPDGSAGARFTACAHVVIANCQIVGGGGPQGDVLAGPRPGTGGTGLEFVASTVAVYDSFVLGGLGEYASFQYDGGNGGLGLDSIDSSVFASHARVQGGTGGDPICAGYGGNGGDALHQTGTSTVTAVECVLSGGTGGADQGCGKGAGTNGSDGTATTAITLVGGPRSMTGPAVVREGGQITLTMTGQPGDQVGLYLSLQPAQQIVLPWNGVLTVSIAPGSGSRLVRMGTVGPLIGTTATLTRTLAIPALPPGVQAQTRWLQTRFVNPQGQNVLGTPLALLVLDAAF